MTFEHYEARFFREFTRLLEEKAKANGVKASQVREMRRSLKEFEASKDIVEIVEIALKMKNVSPESFAQRYYFDLLRAEKRGESSRWPPVS